MVAALVLGTSGAIRGGSSPLLRTLDSFVGQKASGAIRGGSSPLSRTSTKSADLGLRFVAF
jgi:hypothetical protein